MIGGLRENSLYYRAYFRLRRPLLEMLFDGVAWDRKEAAKACEKLTERRNGIKSLLDEQTGGIHLYVINYHRSEELRELYRVQRELREAYNALPRRPLQARKEFKPVIDGIASAICECRAEGRDKESEIGDGLSDQKIADYLYVTLGIPARFERRKGSGKRTVTVKEIVLKKILLAMPEHRGLIELILEHRRCQKLISTYLNPDQLLSPTDGRFHSQYKTFGTQTGRLASGSDPWGFGGNSQNQDREFKWLFLPG